MLGRLFRFAAPGSDPSAEPNATWLIDDDGEVTYPTPPASDASKSVQVQNVGLIKHPLQLLKIAHQANTAPDYFPNDGTGVAGGSNVNKITLSGVPIGNNLEYVGLGVIITADAGVPLAVGQGRIITTFDEGSREATVAPWTVQPSSNASFTLVVPCRRLTQAVLKIEYSTGVETDYVSTAFLLADEAKLRAPRWFLDKPDDRDNWNISNFPTIAGRKHAVSHSVSTQGARGFKVILREINNAVLSDIYAGAC